MRIKKQGAARMHKQNNREVITNDSKYATSRTRKLKGDDEYSTPTTNCEGFCGQTKDRQCGHCEYTNTTVRQCITRHTSPPNYHISWVLRTAKCVPHGT